MPFDGWLGVGTLGGWLGEVSGVVSPGDPEGGLVSVVLPSIENANFKISNYEKFGNKVFVFIKGIASKV